jgi:hypothetical protein
MLVFVAAVEIKTPDKHVEAAIPDILGRGFNSLRLHWFQWEPNPQVTHPAWLAGFLLSQPPVSHRLKPLWFQKIAGRGSNFPLVWFQSFSR